MPIGVIVNVCAVLFGGLIGAFLGDKIPERLRIALPMTFGAASMGMGVSMIVKLNVLPVVVLSMLIGAAVGELIYLEKGIGKLAAKTRGPVEAFFNRGKAVGETNKEFMEKFVGIVVLFCASGTGIFGAMTEGMTGNPTILLTKSFLDFFTAAIFATSLGYLVSAVAIPQAIVMLTLYFSAGLILPNATPAMIGDFSAVGGVIMLATGLRISGIKAFPIANMLPALVFAMPISWLWVHYMIK